MMARVEEIGRFGPSGRMFQIATIMLLAFLALILVGFLYTGIDQVNAGEAAVVLSNVTGKQTVVTDVGYIVHLPFGMTEVYKFRTDDQGITMQGPETVRVKTRDGSSIDVDIELKYRVRRDETSLLTLAHNFGNDPQLTQVSELIRSFARASVRDVLGKLHIQEVTDGTQRQIKAAEITEVLNEELSGYGISMDTVSIPKPNLNPEYQALIDQRMDAINVLTNQASAQEEARQRQAQEIAQATREKNTAFEEEKGRQEKRKIEALGQARQKKARADGEAAKVRVEGDRMYDVAMNDAKALEAEGLAKAKGIRKLAEAYELGGLSLVREALAQKYLGKTIKGQPYDLSGFVERFAVEPAVVIQQSTPNPAQGGN